MCVCLMAWYRVRFMCTPLQFGRRSEVGKRERPFFCTILRRRCCFSVLVFFFSFHFVSFALMLGGMACCSYLATLIRLFSSFIPTIVNRKVHFRFINISQIRWYCCYDWFFVGRFKFQTDAWHLISAHVIVLFLFIYESFFFAAYSFSRVEVCAW